MRVLRYKFTDPDSVIDCLQPLAPATLIVDIEPLIAYWDTDLLTLQRGVSDFLARVPALPTVQAVCFATNSSRRLSLEGDRSGPSVSYTAVARKPLAARQYRNLQKPGVVVGDQVITDGLLAWRLDYSFLQFQVERVSAPITPRLKKLAGKLVEPFIFAGG